MNEQDETEGAEEPRLRQEPDVLPWGALAVIGAALVAAFIGLGVWAWLGTRARTDALRPSRDFPEQWIGPRRRVAGVEQSLFGEVGQGERVRAAQEDAISHYRWVDRSRRVVSIPIDVAMDLVVEEEKR
ncbi:MAG TPA: hypothetical protein VHB21_09280 [Minicystis sp.]|nr:hypothetical protein [Minicystis sp.]